MIECALGGAGDFERTCAVESSRKGNELTLTVLHPNGGFRRLAVADGGQTISAADGAQVASSIKSGDGIEVTIGLDRYRLPAKFLSHDAQ
ncbi:MAG: hypothetical protein J7493_04555 [Porphyrobacter sp.]|nr:hypothetical protein [Porphyrobacter sp.]